MEKIEHKALCLRAEGEYVVLEIEESKGGWVEIIRERIDSPFSHIIEPAGIKIEIKKSRRQKYQSKSQAVKQLQNEGKTIREIAKEMGYKNPGSISYLLKS
jgi:hypothetical protein